MILYFYILKLMLFFKKIDFETYICICDSFNLFYMNIKFVRIDPL